MSVHMSMHMPIYAQVLASAGLTESQMGGDATMAAALQLAPRIANGEHDAARELVAVAMAEGASSTDPPSAMPERSSAPAEASLPAAQDSSEAADAPSATADASSATGRSSMKADGSSAMPDSCLSAAADAPSAMPETGKTAADGERAEDWRVLPDPSGQTDDSYYWNVRTGATTWDRPAVLDAVPTTAPPPSATVEGLVAMADGSSATVESDSATDFEQTARLASEVVHSTATVYTPSAMADAPSVTANAPSVTTDAPSAMAVARRAGRGRGRGAVLPAWMKDNVATWSARREERVSGPDTSADQVVFF